ncbi:MAG: Fic family protein [Egibacteraceae bacterium]
MMSSEARIPWRQVTPLTEVMPRHVRDYLATVDSLRSAWADAVQAMSPTEFEETRTRRLRRHAIETGIIERLYDVGWGVTEALVAEGITAEVAARHGGLSDDALRMIRTQLDALELLVKMVRASRPLTVFCIRELHQAITASQPTYEAADALGRTVHAPLHHGQWKTQPNHVRRQDGTLLEYTPPEHVEAEMGRLVELFVGMGAAHPIVRAAWLHHRFIGVHPFEDGNGRVARALVLLVLLEAHYAPLVVEGRRRDDYLTALDIANDDDLTPLVRLFAELKVIALRSELERPAITVPKSSAAVDVARAYAERLLDLRAAASAERAAKAEQLASELHRRTEERLEMEGAQLEKAFEPLGGRVESTLTGEPGGERAHYWRRQLIRTAREVDFFTNLAKGSWWVKLRLDVLGQRLTYVVAVQKVGHGETGVLALTAFGELLTPDDPESPAVPAFTPTSHDSVTFVSTDDADARWPEAAEVIERTLAASVGAFGQLLTT